MVSVIRDYIDSITSNIEVIRSQNFIDKSRIDNPIFVSKEVEDIGDNKMKVTTVEIITLSDHKDSLLVSETSQLFQECRDKIKILSCNDERIALALEVAELSKKFRHSLKNLLKN